MAGGLPEHLKVDTRLGALGEVSEEGGSRTDSCSKVLPIGGPGGDYFLVGKMGLGGNDAAKTGGGTRGFLEAGDRDVGA